MTISKQYASTHLAGFGGRSQNQSFPQTLEPLTLRSPPPQTIHVCTFPTNVLTLKKNLPGYFSNPTDSQPHHLHKTHLLGGGIEPSHRVAACQTTCTHCWWEGRAGIPFAKIHEVIHLAMNCGPQGFEVWFLQPQNSGFMPLAYSQSKSSSANTYTQS